jgi:hypothetical protein
MKNQKVNRKFPFVPPRALIMVGKIAVEIISPFTRTIEKSQTFGSFRGLRDGFKGHLIFSASRISQSSGAKRYFR